MQVLGHEWLRERQAIKSSVSTVDLGDRNTNMPRRGASATTQFYKAMLAQLREEESLGSPLTDVAETSATFGAASISEQTHSSTQQQAPSEVPPEIHPREVAADAGTHEKPARQAGAPMTKKEWDEIRNIRKNRQDTGQ